MNTFSLPFNKNKISLKNISKNIDCNSNLLSITIKTKKKFSKQDYYILLLSEIKKELPEFSPNSIFINVLKINNDRTEIEFSNFSDIAVSL